MTALDTTPQPATRSALNDYPAGVSGSRHTQAAVKAIEEMAKAEAALEAARKRRDTAIAAAHYTDGLRPPTIARETGMSVSNVRLVLTMNRPRD